MMMMIVINHDSVCPFTHTETILGTVPDLRGKTVRPDIHYT